MPKALVTGATGFVGLNLVEQLLRAGWQVRALHRPSSRVDELERMGALLVRGDVTAPESLAHAIGPDCDAVFHVAADISFWRAHEARQREVNVRGTANALDAARQAGVRRFIHTSTIGVYAMQGTINEASPTHGGHSKEPYNQTKWEAEQLVLGAVEQGMDAVILQPANVLGRHDRSGWGRSIQLAHRGALPAVPPGAAAFCDVEEVARAHVAAFERGERGAHYLLGGVNASFLELLTTVCQVVGTPVPRRTTPDWLVATAARGAAAAARFTRREPSITPELGRVLCANYRADSALAERVLGFREVELASLVRDAHAWLREAGLLDQSESAS